MENLIDTHAHLDMKGYKNVEELVERAKKEGVNRIINISSSLSSNSSVIELTGKYDNIYGSLGVHPHDSKEVSVDIIDFIKKNAKYNNKIVAIGEIGLDFHYMHSPKEDQISSFRNFLQIAQELELPVIIHDREAHEETLKILNEENKGILKGVFHCFSGDVNFARKVLDIGFYISVTGIVTFKNAKVTHDVVKFVPLERILVETDCPFLSPEPNRGKRNEPSFVKFVAMKIAELKDKELSEIAEITTKNAYDLFKKLS